MAKNPDTTLSKGFFMIGRSIDGNSSTPLNPRVMDSETSGFIERVGVTQLTQWSQDPKCANSLHYVAILGQYEAHISDREGESTIISNDE